MLSLGLGLGQTLKPAVHGFITHVWSDKLVVMWFDVLPWSQTIASNGVNIDT